ncbi:unnamed protein product [Ectocarpus sp. 6 AP-2014]
MARGREPLPQRRGRSTPGRWVLLGGVLVVASLLRCCGAAAATADSTTVDLSANPSDTNLGLVSRACSRYCGSGGREFDGLDLWMSLKEICTASELFKGSFAQDLSRGKDEGRPMTSAKTSLLGYQYPDTSEETAAAEAFSRPVGWSLLQSMAVCASVTTLGLFAGFRMGSRRGYVPKPALFPLL